MTKFQLMNSFFEGAHISFTGYIPGTNRQHQFQGRVLGIDLESGNQNSGSLSQFLLTFYDARLGLLKNVYVKTVD